MPFSYCPIGPIGPMVFPMPARATWTSLTDDQLLAQCEVDTYRASGPGGQKRNKTSSAVRLRHLPSGLLVIAEESRSQHENKAKALRRLRRAFFLELRDPITADELKANGVTQHSDFANARDADGRLHLGAKDARFWPAAGVVLDVLAATEARVADAAKFLDLSTGNLVDFLQTDPKLWQAANQLRARFGQKTLR
jgi:RF-1 domain